MKIKMLLAGVTLGLMGVALPVFAAPPYTFQSTLLPLSSNAYDLGTSTNFWRNVFVNNITSYGSATSTFTGPVRSNCFTTDGLTCSTSGGAGTVTQVNTTYPVTGGPITTTGTIALAFGTTTSNTWAGTQTFTNSPVFSTLTAGTVNSTAAGTIYNTATTSLSVSSPLTVTGTFGALIGGTNSTIACQTASGSQAGCLSSTDWNTFNNKPAADWVKQLTFGTASLTPSTTIPVWFKSTIYASSTIQFDQNTLSIPSAVKYIDWQRDAQTDPDQGYTLMRIRAPQTNSRESTLTLYNDLNNNNSDINVSFVDFYNEDYADSNQSGIRVFNTGTARQKPFILGYKTESGGKDAQNVFGILPAGTVFAANATSTVDQNAKLYVASSTASTLFKVDSTPGLNKFIITSAGLVGIGTTTPYAALSVVGGTGIVAGKIYATSTDTSTFDAAPTFTSLTSALIITGVGGLTAEYAGASCTNQFVRSISALGAATCATVGAADVSLANLTATDSTLTFSGTYTGATARTIGLNLANANIWTALQSFNANASTTQLSVTNRAYFGGTSTTTIDVAGTITLPSAASFDASLATFTKITQGTGPTIDAAGKIGIDTTSNTFRYYGTATANLVSFYTTVASVASTTWGAGTTTVFLAPAMQALTVVGVYCETSAGTLGVSLYDGTNRANYIPTASTTKNFFTYTTNNTFTAGESMRVDIGTAASSPTNIGCRFKYTYDAD